MEARSDEQDVSEEFVSFLLVYSMGTVPPATKQNKIKVDGNHHQLRIVNAQVDCMLPPNIRCLPSLVL